MVRVTDNGEDFANICLKLLVGPNTSPDLINSRVGVKYVGSHPTMRKDSFMY